MKPSNPIFDEFRAYWRLSEEMIAGATKEDLAEVARILSIPAWCPGRAELVRRSGASAVATSVKATVVLRS